VRLGAAQPGVQHGLELQQQRRHHRGGGSDRRLGRERQRAQHEGEHRGDRGGGAEPAGLDLVPIADRKERDDGQQRRREHQPGRDAAARSPAQGLAEQRRDAAKQPDQTEGAQAGDTLPLGQRALVPTALHADDQPDRQRDRQPCDCRGLVHWRPGCA
jgi:hypothetical protein